MFKSCNSSSGTSKCAAYRSSSSAEHGDSCRPGQKHRRPSCIHHSHYSFISPLPFFRSIDRTTHLYQLALRYLREAAGGAVLAPRCEVPQLGVQQLDQLGHGSNRGWHVTGTQEAFGLLRQLLGHDRRRLPRPELREGGREGERGRERDKDVRQREGKSSELSRASHLGAITPVIVQIHL